MERLGCLVLLAAVLSVRPSLSQTFTGSIQGRITDPSGGAVPGATVRIMNQNMGFRRSERTNESGDYLFPSLAPGNYQLTAELSGFKMESVREIVLQVNQKLQIDLALKVGDVTETVEVVGAAPLVNTSDPAVGQVIDHTKVLALPLNGRNFVQLAQLTAGVEQRQRELVMAVFNGQD